MAVGILHTRFCIHFTTRIQVRKLWMQLAPRMVSMLLRSVFVISTSARSGRYLSSGTVALPMYALSHCAPIYEVIALKDDADIVILVIQLLQVYADRTSTVLARRTTVSVNCPRYPYPCTRKHAPSIFQGAFIHVPTSPCVSWPMYHLQVQFKSSFCSRHYMNRSILLDSSVIRQGGPGILKLGRAFPCILRNVFYLANALKKGLTQVGWFTFQTEN